MTRNVITEGINRMLDLLDSPEKWIMHESARDTFGNPINPSHEEAVAWCMGGAMTRVTCDSHTLDVRRAMTDFLTKRCQLEYSGLSIPEVNDMKLKDYEDMRSFLKRALLEAEELNL